MVVEVIREIPIAVEKKKILIVLEIILQLLNMQFVKHMW